MLYFAYGSNMDLAQMRGRCPSVRVIAIAKLAEHRLVFTHYAKDRGCGTCDALPEAGQEVWGVIYDISDEDLSRLDKNEGYRPERTRSENSYVRERREVYRGGDKTQPMLVWLYFANRQPKVPPPNAAYMKSLIEGATHWGLPEDYVKQVKQVKTAE